MGAARAGPPYFSGLHRPPADSGERPRNRPCLVLLPGLLCDDAVWREQRRALDSVDRIVPPYGGSASIQDMAQRVLHGVAAAGFSFAGHSMRCGRDQAGMRK